MDHPPFGLRPVPHPSGKGVNQHTSQRLTDLGGCGTLHENLVNVEHAAAVPGD